MFTLSAIRQRLSRESPGWSTGSLIFLVVSFAILAAVGGYLLRSAQVPGASSADVGFARDMSEHHHQAVEMSRLLYDRSDDEIMRSLAYDILVTQQGQIGIMTGYLNAWGHPLTDLGPRMRWMGMPVEGLMPGMATREQLNALAAADGVEAEILFLELMIAHHVGGVHMAEYAAEHARSDVVRRLAAGMAEAQEAEIRFMEQLLQERGHSPSPTTHDDH